MVKEGDKVMCKKSFKFFSKGDICHIGICIGGNILVLAFKTNDHYWFKGSEEQNNSLMSLFSDYFYTNKEVRQLKLKKLKNCD